MAVDLVHTLSENGLSDVPSRFIQPLQRRPTCDGHGTVPVIDLHPLLQQDSHAAGANTTAQAITQACEEWGFFQVVNHGIPTSLLEKVKSVVKGFLDLPMEEKLKRPMKFEPYHPTGYGRIFDFSEETILDWVDALIHYLSPPDLKDPEYWPDMPGDYRKTIEEYGKEVQKLVKMLLSVLSESMGLNLSHLEHTFGGEKAQVVIRVNHYPRCQQPDLVMGLSPHSDGSAVTVLLHDEVEGLQVKKDGCWWTVKPMPGALIVNMGDMMQLASNGRFTSMEHRAVVSNETDRMSIVVFYAPTADVIIDPTPSGDQPHVPLYNSIKYEDYLETYMNKELQGKERINSLLK
eukprot:c15483_g1_i1 orf=84-1124(+)